MVNLKALIEKRNNLIAEMESLVSKADIETRAFTSSETERFNDIKKEVDNIDNTIKAFNESRSYTHIEEGDDNGNKETQEEIEERAFADYISGKVTEMRASTPQNITMSNNGSVIPTTIANRIIKKVKDLCPILAGATIYNVKGTLKIPVWGKSQDSEGNMHDITVGWQQEFTELAADTGKFTSIDLSGYLAGALVLIGKSVANNARIDLVNFIINQMAEEISIWIENILLNATGTDDNGNPCATGALTTSNTLNIGSATNITSDNLIELQSRVKQVHQVNACWTMHPDTFIAIKKLKDGNNRYLLQDDFTGDFPYRLLGKPVYLSDNMPTIGSGAKAVLYGDYSGLSVNIREEMAIEVLREKYATMHALGINAWMEFDSKVTDSQKLAVLVMAE